MSGVATKPAKVSHYQQPSTTLLQPIISLKDAPPTASTSQYKLRKAENVDDSEQIAHDDVPRSTSHSSKLNKVCAHKISQAYTSNSIISSPTVLIMFLSYRNLFSWSICLHYAHHARTVSYIYNLLYDYSNFVNQIRFQSWTDNSREDSKGSEPDSWDISEAPIARLDASLEDIDRPQVLKQIITLIEP